MDAVSPHLVFIKDRVYRLNKEKKYSHGTESNFNGIESSAERLAHLSEVDETFKEMSMECAEFNNEHSSDSTHSFEKEGFNHQIVLPAHFLIKRKNIIEIMKGTRTNIIVNKQNVMTIACSEQLYPDAIDEAVFKVELLIEDFRDASGPNFFLALSFKDVPSIRQRLDAFRTSVLERTYPGIHVKQFQINEKIHLTIGILILLNEEEENKAVDLVKEWIRETKIQPFEVKLSGVESMKENSKKTNVVYAKLQQHDADLKDSLQSLVNSLSAKFIPERLIKRFEAGDNQLLHVTIMNAKFHDYRKFDCTPIIKDFKDYDFGSKIIDSIQIFQMKHNEDRSYIQLCDVKF